MVPNPQLHIFTYKDGWLAKLAHDLCIALQHFEIKLEATQIRSQFDLSSLAVEGAMEREQLNPKRLSLQDCRTINRTIADEILQSDSHSSASFTGNCNELGDSNRYLVAGSLRLMDQTHPLEVIVVSKGKIIEFETTLVPSLWGISPYRAMGGALKLQDRVDVRGRLCLPEPLRTNSWTTMHHRWSR